MLTPFLFDLGYAKSKRSHSQFPERSILLVEKQRQTVPVLRPSVVSNCLRSDGPQQDASAYAGTTV